MEWEAVFELLCEYAALKPRQYAQLCLLCKVVRTAVATSRYAKPLARAKVTLHQQAFEETIKVEVSMEAGAAANLGALASYLPPHHQDVGHDIRKIHMLAHMNVLRTLELDGESAFQLDIASLAQRLMLCTNFHRLVVHRPRSVDLHPFHVCPRLRTVLIHEGEYGVQAQAHMECLHRLAQDLPSLRVLSAPNTGAFILRLPTALRTLSLHSDGRCHTSRNRHHIAERHPLLQPTPGAALRSLVVADWSQPALPLPPSLRSVQLYGSNAGRLLGGCNQLRRVVAIYVVGASGRSFAHGLAAANPPALHTLCLHDTALRDIAVAALPLMNLRTLHICGRSAFLTGSLQTLLNFGAHLTSLTIHGLRFRRRVPATTIDATPPLDLSSLIHVRRIDLRGRKDPRAPPVSLQSLTNLDHLTELSLRCCSFPSLHPLAHCASLRHLDLRNLSALADLTPLVGCARLRSLHVSACPLVSEVAPLVACPALTSLYLGGLFLLAEVDQDALNSSGITDIRIVGCGVNGVNGAYGWYPM